MRGRIIMLAGPEKMEVRDYTPAEPKADEVLVKNEYSAISAGTERANIIDMPNTVHRFNRSFGYNSVGIIIKKGADIKEYEVGDRVLCFFAGGHRSHSIAKAANLCKVPKDVDPRDAALVIIGGFGLEGARRTRLEIGESGLVMGCGILGMFAVQCLKLMGGCPVIAIDFNKQRLEIAKQLGADYIFTPDEENLREKVLAVTGGRGIDAAVEVTGSAKALSQALTLMAKRGRISLSGCTRVSDVPIDFYQFVHRPGVQLLGCHTSVRPSSDSFPGCWTAHDDHRTLLDLIAAGRLRVAPIISETVSPENAVEVYDRLAKDANAPLGVLFDWNLILQED